MEDDAGSFAWAHVKGSHSSQQEIREALRWICAAFRASKEKCIFISETTITKRENTILNYSNFKIELALLEPVSEGSCWHGIFDRVVVAKGFRIAERREGIGLEISCSNMPKYADCLKFT